MENNTQDDLKAQLLATDDHFRNLHNQHAKFKQLIDEIESKGLVTEADEIEEHRIKKLKLHVKDEMNEIITRYRVASVG